MALYRNGVRWWLTNDEEATAMAHDEQADRQIEDAWQHRISGFLEDKDSSSVDEILSRVIDKPCGSWTQHEQNRAAACLRKAGFTRSAPLEAGVDTTTSALSQYVPVSPMTSGTANSLISLALSHCPSMSHLFWGAVVNHATEFISVPLWRVGHWDKEGGPRTMLPL